MAGSEENNYMKYKVIQKTHTVEEITTIADSIYKQVMDVVSAKKEIALLDVEIEVGKHTKPEFVKEVSRMILKKAEDNGILESPYLWVRLSKKLKAWRGKNGN